MRRLIGSIAGLAATAALAGCGSAHKDAATPGATEVVITLTNDGCAPNPASIPAGPVTFKVSNTTGDAVTEAELMSGDTIVGEKENLTPGLSGSFALNLKAGKYTVQCPDAKTPSYEFTVTGDATAGALDPAAGAKLDAAVEGYRAYVIGAVDQLIPATKAFTDAVRAGDVEKAKNLYAKARYHYEEIEPVAESFGDLDPDVDARADDVADPATWSGFHRIEKALWADKSLAGMSPIADKLDADVSKLKTLVAAATYQPAQLANGATELLNEVAGSKITGEEDRYSHTDLSDFEANTVGAKKAFDLLLPALSTIDPTLAATITQRFADVNDALAKYRGTYADSGYVDYSTVPGAGRKLLTQKVDALAEPLSEVAAKVAA